MKFNLKELLMSIERQELRETAQIDEGVLRYRRQVEQQGEANSNVGLDLCHRVMASVIPTITENVMLLESGKTHPSQVPLAYQYLTEMDPDDLRRIEQANVWDKKLYDFATELFDDRLREAGLKPAAG